jgi:transposase
MVGGQNADPGEKQGPAKDAKCRRHGKSSIALDLNTPNREALVVMEACGSAHYWAREMIRFGHDVKLITPHYVKPFLKRQKNDSTDAEAIVEAASRPTMPLVEPKSADQQGRAILVHQRTELVNALRACLYEYGHVVPQGIRQIKRIEEILDASNSDLPDFVA